MDCLPWRTAQCDWQQRLKGCFKSAETMGLLGMGAQDVHLNFHTAHELWAAAVSAAHWALIPFSIGQGGTTSCGGGGRGGMVMDDNDGHKNATRLYIAGRIGQGGQSRVLGLSWAQHRLRVLIRLPHVKNCQFFLCKDKFLLFEILLLYLNCVEEKK